jgi:tRNA pseudouridine38-40 synthase
MNIKMTVEYDGADYHGWQIQPNGKTIQQVLEQAFENVLKEKVRVNASGRTDAGVHAFGQVANVVCSPSVDLWHLQRGINALTPADIVVKKMEIVADFFDARWHARSRVYEYRIWNAPWPSALHRRDSWHVHIPLDMLSMQEAAGCLEGEHNLSSFQAAGCDAAHPIRKIFHNSLSWDGQLILYTVEATAYLRHMVRNIVGTLVEVGKGHRSPEDFSELLRRCDRTQAGPTAPAHGLFLVEVKY